MSLSAKSLVTIAFPFSSAQIFDPGRSIGKIGAVLPHAYERIFGKVWPFLGVPLRLSARQSPDQFHHPTPGFRGKSCKLLPKFLPVHGKDPRN